MLKNNFFLLLLSYVILALCYPPFSFSFLIFVVFVPIFLLTSKLNKKNIFWSHFLASIPHNFILYYWMYHVMGIMPSISLFIGLLLFVLIMSTFSGYLGKLIASTLSSRHFLWLLPLIWSGFEVFRTKGPISFPWVHLGYTLGDYLPMIQVVSVMGVFGLSFLILLTNTLFFKFIKEKKYVYLVLAFFIPLFLFLYGSITLLNKPLPHKTIKVHVVQPAINQLEKWDEDKFKKHLTQTYDLIDQIVTKRGDLIVLPETAIPDFLRSRPYIKKYFQELVNKKNISLAIGGLHYTKDVEYHYFNALFLFQPNKNSEIYSKIKLVPFSERLPFDDFFSIIKHINIGQSGFTIGSHQSYWKSLDSSYTFSPSICYEVVYPFFIRDLKNNGTQLLINSTNDAWFGNSIALDQHININRFRSVELNLPIARAANTGISLFYDGFGNKIKSTKPNERTFLSAEIPLYNKKTLYQIIGTAFETLLFFIWLFYCLITMVKWYKTPCKA